VRARAHTRTHTRVISARARAHPSCVRSWTDRCAPRCARCARRHAPRAAARLPRRRVRAGAAAVRAHGGRALGRCGR
jgi:hypothetical protein